METLRELLETTDSECPFTLLTAARNRSVLERWGTIQLGLLPAGTASAVIHEDWCTLDSRLGKGAFYL